MYTDDDGNMIVFRFPALIIDVGVDSLMHQGSPLERFACRVVNACNSLPDTVRSSSLSVCVFLMLGNV